MRAVEVAMNQQLTYNLIWVARARAVIISNDAKGSFDHTPMLLPFWHCAASASQGLPSSP